MRRTLDVCARRLAVWLLTRPRAWRFAFDPPNENRDFGRAVARIWLAYRMECLRYGLFAARKPRRTASVSLRTGWVNRPGASTLAAAWIVTERSRSVADSESRSSPASTIKLPMMGRGVRERAGR